ncbi:MAG: RDD family protein [Spirulina sp. SIO3F2]|nr:RDD family protein [Spirulina sp. SIO3F2]
MRSDDSRPVPQKFPRVPFERRFYAFGIDFLSAWLLSSFVTGIAQNLIFLVIWGVLRIVVVDRNQGQSLGSWCMDIKVLDLRFRRIPDIYTLLKREAVIGVLAMLALDGLTLVGRYPFSTLLLVSLLLIDCAIAYTDEKFNQAVHDRLFDTVMIQTRRGYSLDIRIRDLLDDLQYRMRR